MSNIEKLIKQLKDENFLNNPKLESALRKVPTESFIPKKQLARFFSDNPTIFHPRKTLSAPHMICIMIQKLKLAEGMNVLVLGAKSGYLEALIAEMVKKDGFVYIFESDQEICDRTELNLLDANYERWTSVLHCDPLKGYPGKGPWDRILVTGQVPNISKELKEQLTNGGFILAPIGRRTVDPKKDYQEFTKIQKYGNKYIEKSLGEVIFGPLVSNYAKKIPQHKVKESGITLEEAHKQQMETLRGMKKMMQRHDARMIKEFEDMKKREELILSSLKFLQSEFGKIKDSDRTPEEKIPASHELLHRVEENIQKNMPDEINKYKDQLAAVVRNCDKLEGDSKIFIATGEYLCHIFDISEAVKGDVDYSSISLEYCKVMELEVLSKVFDGYKHKLIEEHSRKDPTLHNLYNNLDSDVVGNEHKTLIPYLKDKKKLDLGGMKMALELLTGDTINDSPVLQGLKNYIEEKFEKQNFLLDKLQLPYILEKTRTLYRNGAVHTGLTDKNKAYECREYVIENVDKFLDIYLHRPWKAVHLGR